MVSSSKVLFYIYNNKLVLNSNGWYSLITKSNKYTKNIINKTDKLIIHNPNHLTNSIINFPRVRHLTIIGYNNDFFNKFKYPSLLSLSILYPYTYQGIIHMHYVSDKQKCILQLNSSYLSEMINIRNLYNVYPNNLIIKDMDQITKYNLKKSAIDSLSEIRTNL